MDEKALQQIMEQFTALNGRFDHLEYHRSEDRKALMDTLSTIDGRLDRLEQQVGEIISRSNDLGVRHRHLVHKVADLEESVAALHDGAKLLEGAHFGLVFFIVAPARSVQSSLYKSRLAAQRLCQGPTTGQRPNSARMPR